MNISFKYNKMHFVYKTEQFLLKSFFYKIVSYWKLIIIFFLINIIFLRLYDTRLDYKTECNSSVIVHKIVSYCTALSNISIAAEVTIRDNISVTSSMLSSIFWLERRGRRRNKEIKRKGLGITAPLTRDQNGDERRLISRGF